MGKFLRHFSDWFALFGLVFLFVGMLGTARQIKELNILRSDPPAQGFLPMTVEMHNAEIQIHPTITPFQPVQVTEVIPLPMPEVSTKAFVFLPSVSSGRADLQETPAPASINTIAKVSLDLQPAAIQPTPQPEPAVPDWIDIPVIGLSAPVTAVAPVQVSLVGQLYDQWTAPDYAAAGWHERSAKLFENGNVVMNGHHNIYGSVFANLKDLHSGDEIIAYAHGQESHYVVAQVMILEERNASLEQRADNARWILPSGDSRLTLVTCWPPESNTHRVIVVAKPEGNP